MSRVGGAQGGFVGGALCRRKGAQRINQIAQARLFIRVSAIRFRKRFMRQREGTDQITQHSRILRALPREQHGQLAGRGAGAKARAVRVTPRFLVGMLAQHRPRAGDHFRQVSSLALYGQHQPASSVRFPRRARLGAAHTQLVPRAINRPRCQLGFEGVGAVGAEGQQLHIAVPIDLRHAGFGFFKDAVEITAAEAERADAGSPRMIRRRQPRPFLRIDVERRPPALQHVERLIHL